MKLIRVCAWMVCVFPLVFIISVLGGPFYALCCWAGEREVIEPMLERVGDYIKESLINFSKSK